MAQDNVIASFLVALGFRADTTSQQQATKSVQDYEKAVKDAEGRIVAARLARAKNAEQVAQIQMAADLKAAREALKRAQEQDKAQKQSAKEAEEAEKKRQKAQSESTAFALAKVQLIIHAFEALARAAKAAFSDTVTSFDQLYYASGRTGASVNNLRSLGHAFSQVGGNSAQAVGAVESFTRALRNNPGLEGFVRGLGVDPKLDGVEKMLATIDKLNEQPRHIAVQQAGMLGISEEAYDLLTRQSAGIRKYREEYKQAAAAVGLNEEEAAKASHRFSQSMGSLSVIIEASFSKLLTSMLPQISGWLDSFATWIRTHQPEIGAFVQSVANGFEQVAAWVKQAFIALQESFQDGSAKKRWDEFLSTLNNVATAFNNIYKAIKELTSSPAWQILWKALSFSATWPSRLLSSLIGGAEASTSGGSLGGGLPSGSTSSVRGGEGGSSYTSGGGAVGKAQQGANASAIMDELKKAGYNSNAIAAIMGSMQTESSFNPSIVNSSGHTGLWQWDKNVRWPKIQKWIKEQGGDPNDPRWQTKAWIAEHDAKPGDQLYDGVQTSQGGAILRNNPTSVDDALRGVQLSERYGPGEEGGRGANARAWLPHVNGTAPVPGGGPVAAGTAGTSVPHIQGALNFEGKSYDFGSGGHNGGQSIPFGTYPITPDTIGPWGQANNALGINNNAIWDKSLNRMRTGIEFHASDNADKITAGCIGIAKEQYGAFRAHVLDFMKRKGGAFLTVNPDGSASISAERPNSATAEAAAKPAPVVASEAAPPAARRTGPGSNMTPGGYDVSAALKPAGPMGASASNTDNSQNNKTVQQHNNVKVEVHGSNDPERHGKIMEASLGRTLQLSLENAQGAMRA